jgi:hypothetical protein
MLQYLLLRAALFVCVHDFELGRWIASALGGPLLFSSSVKSDQVFKGMEDQIRCS